MRKSEDPHGTTFDAKFPVPDLKDTPDVVLNDSLCFLVQRANRIVSRKLDDALRPTGLNSRQMVILDVLGRHESLSQTALADIVGKDHTTLTANLGPLTSRGLVTSEVDGGDRRVRNIALTADGAVLLHHARRVLETFESALCGRLESADDLVALKLALHRLGDAERLPHPAGEDAEGGAGLVGAARNRRRQVG